MAFSPHLDLQKQTALSFIFFSFINAGSSCISKQNIYVSLKWLVRPMEQTDENKEMYSPVSRQLSEASILISSWKQTKKKKKVWFWWKTDSCILYFCFHSNKCSCLPFIFSSHTVIHITLRQEWFENLKVSISVVVKGKVDGWAVSTLGSHFHFNPGWQTC